MTEQVLYIILGVGIGLLIGYLFAKISFHQSVRAIRKQSVKQSKATTLGYVHEKIAPLLPDFPYSYKDLMFIGKGIDYLVFDGLSEGDVQQVVLLEIKTGTSRLNRNERMIRDTVRDGNISYQVLRMK